MSNNGGGPAFPSEQHETQDGCWNQTYEAGMTLRDYFAGQAIAGVIDPKDFNTCDQCYADVNMKYYAELSYQMADAMLAIREKTV